VYTCAVINGPVTVDTYQRLAELGVLREDDRVERIDGQVARMTPIGDRHANCVRRLNRLFSRHVLEVAIVDVQPPVVLGEHDAPQPDLALLKPRADAYRKHPRPPDTLLVIEVADTSVAQTRDIKIPLYARAGSLVSRQRGITLSPERLAHLRRRRPRWFTFCLVGRLGRWLLVSVKFLDDRRARYSRRPAPTSALRSTARLGR